MAGDDEIKFTSKSVGLVLIILTIISILASAVIAYAVTNETATHNTEDIQELKVTCEDIKIKVEQNTINVAVLNKIAEDVKDIKQDIKVLNSKVN